MNKVRQFFSGIAGFIEEVGVELKKSDWPSSRELIGSTVVVILSVMLLGFFIGLSDLVLIRLLRLLVVRY